MCIQLLAEVVSLLLFSGLSLSLSSLSKLCENVVVFLLDQIMLLHKLYLADLSDVLRYVDMLLKHTMRKRLFKVYITIIWGHQFLGT